ncbi:MAG TPA: PhzF family phenazine biosynthesis protein [Chitinophagaceae bacterium]|nr:PhzF family phenazine biosynthesis protein [Chitinophagaceae bacterium]
MTTLPIYQVDAFTENIFEGNPAAICPMESWLSDEQMQKIAMENNLAETAFIVPFEDAYQIRWFTPTVEVALCGHATLAAAHCFYEQLGYTQNPIRFFSKSGWLTVSRTTQGKLTLDFPADQASEALAPEGIFEGLGISSRQVYKGKFDYLVELENEAAIAALNPDFRQLSTIQSRGVLVTAKGDQADFVSRCFFPQSGIDEDPVTGSAHCLLTTYWHSKTGRSSFTAIQLSHRKGRLECELKGDRVLMTGSAKTYLKGEIYI